MDELPEAVGDCYQIVLDVAELMEARWLGDVRIVHGIPTGRGQIEGVRFGHAWVEGVLDDEPVVVDCSNGLRPRFFEKEGYYRLGKINANECVIYTIPQCKRKMRETGNFGPWTEAHMAVA